MAVGLPGLILATFLSGVFLIVAGALRFGTYIRYIPYPVTVGFTAGIAVIIFASQLREMFGVRRRIGERDLMRTEGALHLTAVDDLRPRPALG